MQRTEARHELHSEGARRELCRELCRLSCTVLGCILARYRESNVGYCANGYSQCSANIGEQLVMASKSTIKTLYVKQSSITFVTLSPQTLQMLETWNRWPPTCSCTLCSPVLPFLPLLPLPPQNHPHEHELADYKPWKKHPQYQLYRESKGFFLCAGVMPKLGRTLSIISLWLNLHLLFRKEITIRHT